MDDLDRVLDRDDVLRRLAVHVVDHRRERRGLARARGAGDEDDPALLLGELADDPAGRASSIVAISNGIARQTSEIVPRWRKALTRKRRDAPGWRRRSPPRRRWLELGELVSSSSISATPRARCPRASRSNPGSGVQLRRPTRISGWAGTLRCRSDPPWLRRAGGERRGRRTSAAGIGRMAARRGSRAILSGSSSTVWSPVGASPPGGFVRFATVWGDRRPPQDPDPRPRCLAQFMIILDVSIVNVALPSIRRDLRFSVDGLQWIVTAYTLAFAGFLLLGRRAADLIGRRAVLRRRAVGCSAWPRRRRPGPERGHR